MSVVGGCWWGYRKARFCAASFRNPALYTINSSFSEQTLRAHEQKQQRHHVGEPSFDATADVWPEIHLGKFFKRADQQPADDGAEHGFEAAQNKHRQRLQCDKR